MPHLQTRVAFLPFGPKLLKSLKPVTFDRSLPTLGDHLKKRRHELGLFQREVADRLDVDTWTYLLWEQNNTRPGIHSWPKVISFLQYDPNPAPVTLGDQILSYRRKSGIPRSVLAKRLGVDENTVWRWEASYRSPPPNIMIQLRNLGEINHP